MIQAETITINGRQFQRTYSDAGFLIERDGAQYSEAVDPLDSGRTYTETEEKAFAYDILMGWRTGLLMPRPACGPRC